MAKGSRRAGRRRRTYRMVSDDRRRTMLLVDTRSGGDRGERLHRAGAIALIAVTVLVACVLSWYTLRWTGARLFLENPAFAIRDLKVSTHGELLSESFIKQCLQVNVGTNLFAVDIGEVRNDFLSSAPSVRRMYISRHLPDTLAIEVWERLPLARLAGNNYLVLDREGFAFSYPPTLSDLPLLAGYQDNIAAPGDKAHGLVVDALRVIDYVERSPVGQDVRVSRVIVDERNVPREDTLKIELATGEFIYFWWRREPGSGVTPEEDLRDRLTYLRDCLMQVREAGDRVATMDLTLDDYRNYTVITKRKG